MEKETLKQAAIFEKQCRNGLSLDNHQTFAAYAEHVLKQKERTGVKRSTLARYRDDLERILLMAFYAICYRIYEVGRHPVTAPESAV